MKRLIAAIVAVCAVMPVAAGADVDAGVVVRRSTSVNVWQNEAGVVTGASVYVEETSTEAGTATRAQGSVHSCPPATACTVTTYDWQPVPDGSLTMDPIGNSASIAVCLVPNDAPSGPCDTFTLTLSKPGNLGGCYPTYTLCASGNGWADPNDASAAVHANAHRYRDGYRVLGSFAGIPVTAGAHSMSSTMQMLTAQLRVD